MEDFSPVCQLVSRSIEDKNHRVSDGRHYCANLPSTWLVFDILVTVVCGGLLSFLRKGQGAVLGRPWRCTGWVDALSTLIHHKQARRSTKGNL